MLKINKIKPMFTAIVTTMNKLQGEHLTAGGIIDPTKPTGVSEYQTVIAVGPNVMNVKVGDLVCINPTRFRVMKHKAGSLKDGVIGDNLVETYNFPIVILENKQYLLLQDRDIDYIVEEYEEIADPQPSVIIQPSTDLIKI